MTFPKFYVRINIKKGREYMFILFILSIIAALVHPNGEPTATAIFFSFGPMIYELDCIVRNFVNYQKMRFFHRKSKIS